MVMAGMERLRTNNARINVAMGRLAGELDRDRTKPELHFLPRVQASAVGGSALQRRWEMGQIRRAWALTRGPSWL